MMTPEEARKAWVDALRSGQYKQVKGKLSDGVGHCCLGVACELAIKDGVPVERSEFEDRTTYDGEAGVLPASVCRWLALASCKGVYTTRNHRETTLAARNDKGATFAQIAAIIEYAPTGLFTDEVTA